MREPRILVVDDQKGIRSLIVTALEEENYQVYTASGGIESIAVVQKVKPDLIILDMKMPGMSGLEVKKELDLLNINIPVIMMTAYGEINLVNKLKEQGMEYLLKPFDIAELKQKVSALLEPQVEKIHA